MTDTIKVEVAHNPSCGKSGGNKCQDNIHLATEFNKKDRNLLKVILNNYFHE